MKIKSILIVASIGMMFAACSSREEFNQEASRKPIEINASIEGMMTRSQGGATELQNTAFVEGAKIYVYMEEANEGRIYPGVPEDPGYLVYTKGASGWTTTTTMFWGTEGIRYYGIHPSTYNDGSNEISLTKDANTFTVQSYQKYDDEYRESDLMYATGWSYSPSSPITMNFKHCLTKITVKIDPNEVLTQEQFDNSLYSIWIKNVKRTASLGASFNATASGNAGDICILDDYEEYNPNGVSFIIPPQQLTAGTQFIKVCFNDAADYFYFVPEEGLDFVAGREYIFNLKLTKSSVLVGEPTIGDWQPGTGTPIDGNLK